MKYSTKAKAVHDKKDRGFVIPTILVSLFFLITIAVTLASLSISINQTANRESYKVNAQFTADSGLDIGIQKLNANENWTGQAETLLYSDSNMKSTYAIEVINGATSDKKTIKTTSKVYSPATATTPKFSRIYELDVQAVTSGTGLTSVVSGVGGLVLNNNARITGGDVVVNGTITINNNAQIGLSTTNHITNPNQVVNVRVAHTNCPSPVTAAYPRVCGTNENGQPITVGTNGRIYADVRATNQTTSTGMSNPGLVPNQTVAPYTMPEYDRAAHKAAVATTVAPSSNTVSCGNNGTKTWPANLRITGNISLGNNCTVTISGNVWVDGSVTMGNGAKFVISGSVGTTRPTMMIDGSAGIVFGNNNTVQQNVAGTGMFIITYYCGAGCSQDTNPVTGTTLAAAQTALTIDLSNNSSAPGSVLYARWSKVRISNNGSIGAVAGQSIELGNNAVINFTSSVPGSSNLTKTWVKRGYLRVFN